MMKNNSIFFSKDILNITAYLGSNKHHLTSDDKNELARIFNTIFEDVIKNRLAIYFVATTQFYGNRSRISGDLKPEKNYYLIEYKSKCLRLKKIENLHQNITDSMLTSLFKEFYSGTQPIKLEKIKNVIKIPDWNLSYKKTLNQAKLKTIQYWVYDAENRFNYTPLSILKTHPHHQEYYKAFTAYPTSGLELVTLKKQHYHWRYLYYWPNQALSSDYILELDINYLGQALPFHYDLKPNYQELQYASLIDDTNTTPILRTELFIAIEATKKPSHRLGFFWADSLKN
ncbi:hypothetical protein G9F32_09090 [Acinetobacter sp. 194]|uniref:hypothetical protein n=1 Tax=Acinetobacter shaoyimingii TaxID=2715164 RepID=UPI001409C86C|nr:hypothetical protein [Acinetobacter shaoyimingii]NHB58172.1 hypothetical protein [Acinetobacter shaoyimingii]